MQGKIKQKGITRVSVYFGEAEFAAVAKETEDAGFRRVGIPLKKQKPHGFADEWVGNTKGVSNYLKACHKYFVADKARRLEEAARLEREKAELAAREEGSKLISLKKGKVV